MKKKYYFVNPIGEAIRIQGKRWVVALLVAIALLLVLSITAFLLELPICGTVAAVAAVAAFGFNYWWFGGIEIKFIEKK